MEKNIPSWQRSNSKLKNREILFNKLLKLANKELEVVKSNEIKESIDKVLNINGNKKNDSKETITFGKMIDYNEFIINDEMSKKYGLRQDNENILKYPNKVSDDININKLKQSKLVNFYDSTIYLSNLIITANSLNSIFHDTMRNVMLKDINDNESDSNSNILNYEYKEGPLKDISRCQAKSESDYSDRPFPNSANLIDIIRCSIVYENSIDLVNDMNNIKNRIDKGDTCIKKILRIKNKFLVNKEEYFEAKKNSEKKDDENEWLYNYGDIKFNVLIEYNNMSLIGEIQFLLSMMLNNKKKCHALYNIIRQEDFINNMKNILSVTSNNNNKQEQLFFLLHSCKYNNKSIKLLSQFLISYSNDIDLGMKDDNEMNAFHYCCEFGNTRLFNLLVNFVQKKEKETNHQLLIKHICEPTRNPYVLYSSDDNDTQIYCSDLAIKSGNYQFLNKLVLIGNNYDIKWKNINDSIMEYFIGKKKWIDLKLINTIVNSGLINWEKLLVCGVKYNNYKIVEYILTQQKLKNIKVNINSRLLLSTCIDTDDTYELNNINDNLKIFQLLLLSAAQDNINLSETDDNGWSVFLDIVKHDKLQHMKYLIENNGRFKWKINDNLIYDINTKNRNIFHIASQHGSYKVLYYLINECNYLITQTKSNKLRNKTDNNYQYQDTALLTCVSEVKNGYDSNNELECNNFQLFKLLLSQSKIDINICDDDDNSPLMKCIYHNKLEYVKYLLEKIRIDTKLFLKRNHNGENIFHIAAKGGSYTTLDYIINGNNTITKKIITKLINQKDKTKERTPLLTCIEEKYNGYDSNNELNCNNFKIFTLLLLQSGINVNIKDKEKRSIFINCVYCNKLEYIKYLEKNNGEFDWKLKEDIINADILTLKNNISDIVTKYDCHKTMNYLLLEKTKTKRKINNSDNSNNTDNDDLKAENEIEKAMSRYKQTEEIKYKLLLLGAGESGKSSILKQMRSIHGTPFSDVEKLAAKVHLTQV